MHAQRWLAVWAAGLVLAALLGTGGGCKGEEGTGERAATAPGGGTAAPTGGPAAVTPLPEFDYGNLPFKLQVKIGAARQQAARDPHNVDKVRELGALCHVHGFPQAAVACLQRVAELAPKDFRSWYELGLARERAGDAAGAIAAFEQALAISDLHPPAHARLAALLAGQGRSAEAERHREAAAGVRLDQPGADGLERDLLRRGLDLNVLLENAAALAAVGRFDEAEALLQDAHAVDDAGLRTRTTLAAVRGMQGRTEEGIRGLELLLAEHPEHLPAKAGLAALRAQAGQHAEAEKLLREVLAATPLDLQSLEGFCALMKKQGKPAEALPLLEQAQQAAPEDAGVLHKVGTLLRMIGEHARAVEVLRRALELAPDSAEARHLLGLALYEGGDKAAGQREWEEILRRQPGHVPARMAQAFALVEARQHAAAITSLREGLRHTPRSPTLANALAWILATSPDASLRNGEEAVNLALQAARATDRQEAQVLDTLAAAYAESGRFDEARNAILEALRVAQQSGQAELVQEFEARRALYEAGQPYHEPP